MIEVFVPFVVSSGADCRLGSSLDGEVGQIAVSRPFVALRGAERGGRRAQGEEAGR